MGTNSYNRIRFEYNSIDSIPGDLFLYYDLMMIKENLILSGIKVISHSPHALNMLGIEKVDTSFIILNSDTLGSMNPDTLSYPGYFTNIDISNSSTIYYGGTFHQDNYQVFSYYDSWILLAKFDSNLNLQWEKFYGGDIYYDLWGLRATNDGGCLLLGSTYDDQIQYNERDIIIIKVDSNGVITEM